MLQLRGEDMGYRAIVKLAAIVTCISCPAAAAGKSEWWQAGFNESNGLIFFIDRNSISEVTSPRRAYKAWEWSFSAKPDKYGSTSAKSLIYYDCQASETNLISVIRYSPKGDPVYSNTWTAYSGWDPAAPDTIADVNLKFVCNSEQGSGNAAQFSVDDYLFIFTDDPQAQAKAFLAESAPPHAATKRSITPSQPAKRK